MRRAKRFIVGASAFVFAVGSVVGLAGSPASASSPAELRMGDAAVLEGDGTTNGSAKISLRLSEPLTSTVCVWYHTEPGTATGAPNTKTHDAISVVVDMVSGMTGTACNTSPDPSVVVLDSSAVVTILDDDPAPGTPTVSVGDATVPEGNGVTNGSAKLGLRLSQPQPTTKCVWYHTENGSATGAPNTKTHDANNDYLTRTDKTAKIPATKVVGTISITTLYDTASEPNESFYVVIDKVSDTIGTACDTAADPTVAIGRASGTVTITDDDGVAGAPGAPTGVTAALSQDPCTDQCGNVDVTWNLPASDGGSPVTSYDVYADFGDGFGFVLYTRTLSPNITAYCGVPAQTCTFLVYANNAVGRGPGSSASNTITTQNVPGAPTGVTASLGSPDGVVDLVWTAPTDDGGSPVTSYDVYADFGAGFGYYTTTLSTSFSASFGYGTTVQFQVYANNAVGQGPASAASNSVTTPSSPE
ncbi:MAG: fibronectin type III domain-containing protein [Actinobacteria bacterium]|nr:fibronectin type III domain-containing protein [Actinomycetota bacterium]